MDKEQIDEREGSDSGQGEGEQRAVGAALLYRVKVLHSSATEYCAASIDLARGDHVVVPTRYGKALAVVLGTLSSPAEVGSSEIAKVERKAQAEDLESYSRNREKDENAFQVCLEKIDKYKLEMKLVSAHYLLGEPKIIFFFTAETRVDFRALVKDLVAVFKTRVELRQIGVRDESRVLGGMGVCGRGFCCHKLTDRMSPVSIKMAKKQDLSLNSLKISGPCGRLLCCLAYEYPYYNEEKSKVPSTGTRLSFEGERCRVSDVNILSRKLRLSGESGRMVELPLDRFRYVPCEKRWAVIEDDESRDESSDED